MADSTFAGNQATNGGAINNADNAYDSGMLGTLTVFDSTFSLNSAATDGGAVDSADNDGNGTATITSSTFSENYATTDGGSIDNADNSGSGTTSLGATILAGAPTGGECSGTITDEGYNIDDDSSCGLTAPSSLSDLPNLDVTLGALKQNQGLTQTILPDSNSPAVGVIPNDTNVGATQVCPTTDQQAVASAPGGSCNIGATQTTLAAPTISAVTFAGTPASPTVTVWGSGFGTEADLGDTGPAYSAVTRVRTTDSSSTCWTVSVLARATGRSATTVGVSISSYSDDQITFTFGSAYPGYGEVNHGDDFSMTVLGTTFNGHRLLSGHTQAGPAPYAYVANHGGDTVTPISTEHRHGRHPDQRRKRTLTPSPSPPTVRPPTWPTRATARSPPSPPPPIRQAPPSLPAPPSRSHRHHPRRPDRLRGRLRQRRRDRHPTATNTAGTPFAVGTGPDAIAITPDGQTAYVANGNDNDVVPVNTTNDSVGTPIPVGGSPVAIAITPDGETAYVANNRTVR